MEQVLYPLKVESLTIKTADALKKYIVAENLKEGDKLPSEGELSQILMVSRNVIREALKSLESIGIIYKKHGKGIFVGSFKSNLLAESLFFGLDKFSLDVDELLEVRKAFEVCVLRLIFNKIEEEDIRDLQGIIDKIKENAEKRQPTIKEDLDFHIRLLRIIKNEAIERFGIILVDFFRELILDRPDIIISDSENTEVKIKRHQRILDALKERNLKKVIKYMIKHFDDGYKLPVVNN
jgi:GntR family transcriptional regulator, transcriptional repressor for pyruvate dehydrogenase complex